MPERTTRRYTDLLVMLHPLLNDAAEKKRSAAESRTEDPAMDTSEERAENPSLAEFPADEMPLGEAAEFWKEVIDGMAAFEIDVERKFRRDEEQANAERNIRLQKAHDQKQEFMSRFRNTARYKALMAQRKDGAHAFNSEIRKRKVAARKMNRPPTLPTFQQFAQETNHPALGFSPAKAAAAAAGTSTQRDYSSATQSASSQKRYCKRCGWKELPSTVTLLYPPLVKDQDPSGRITWTPAPGYEVETSHITDQCPTYKTQSLYRCARCARLNITAFHYASECSSRRNPHNQYNLATIVVDDQGNELEDLSENY